MADTPELSHIHKARPAAKSLASILVVDDDNVVRTTLCQLLQKHDYQVSEAKDGEEALTLLKKQIFQVVLLDEYMPGKRGLEVMHEARQNGCTSETVQLRSTLCRSFQA